MNSISLVVTGKINLPVSARKAVQFLQDLENLPRYEPRVRAVEVKRKSRREGVYRARGRIGGVNWLASFRYFRTASGFVSEMIGGPSWPRIQGGFTVRERSNRTCEIIHGERYELPLWMKPMCPMIERMLENSVREELLMLERGLVGGVA